ncbi:hypothetical protein ACS0TY_035629 [Phlomoides rotata]
MACVSLHVSTSANKACITSNPSFTPRSVSFLKPAKLTYSLNPSKSNAPNTGVPIRSYVILPNCSIENIFAFSISNSTSCKDLASSFVKVPCSWNENQNSMALNPLKLKVQKDRSFVVRPSTTSVDCSKISLVSGLSDLSVLEAAKFFRVSAILREEGWSPVTILRNYSSGNSLLFSQGNSSCSKFVISSPVIVTCLPNEKLSATAQNPFDSEEARRDGSKFCYEPWIRRVCILVIGVHVILVFLPLVKPHIIKVYYLLNGAPVGPEPVRAVVGRVARTLVTSAWNVCAWTVNMRAGGVTNNALISIGTINYYAPGRSIWDLIPALILLLQEARMDACKKKHASTLLG